MTRYAEDADGDEAPPTFEEALTLCPVHADAAAGTENGDDGGEQAPALAVLMAMGFARDAAAAALSQAANDVERAAALLLDNALVSPQNLEVRPTLPVFHTRKPLRFLCARHLA